jgi:hypothetical protein
MLLFLKVLHKKTSGGGRNFTHRPDRPPGLTQASVQWVQGLFPGDGSAALTVLPNLAPRLQKEVSYTYTPPLGLHDLF